MDESIICILTIHKQEVLNLWHLFEIPTYQFFLSFFFFCYFLEFGSSTDTITAAKFISDPEIIISNGGSFQLGFLSPPNSTYRYVGIWYSNISVSLVIWVANRNQPLKNSSGILAISKDGNLVVLDGQKKVLWSSNLTSSVVNSSAQLLDNGNLVL
jgi:hypothetical protein